MCEAEQDLFLPDGMVTFARNCFGPVVVLESGSVEESDVPVTLGDK